MIIPATLRTYLINHATLKIDQRQCPSAGTKVNIDGGVLDLNDKTVTIGDLSHDRRQHSHRHAPCQFLHVQSGTITALLAGPGDLTKTGSGHGYRGTRQYTQCHGKHGHAYGQLDRLRYARSPV